MWSASSAAGATLQAGLTRGMVRDDCTSKRSDSCTPSLRGTPWPHRQIQEERRNADGGRTGARPGGGLEVGSSVATAAASPTWPSNAGISGVGSDTSNASSTSSTAWRGACRHTPGKMRPTSATRSVGAGTLRKSQTLHQRTYYNKSCGPAEKHEKGPALGPHLFKREHTAQIVRDSKHFLKITARIAPSVTQNPKVWFPPFEKHDFLQTPEGPAKEPLPPVRA